MIHSLPPRPDPSRPDHAGFVRDVLAQTSYPGAVLDWRSINDLAARRLRPDAGETSRLGHAFVLEMAASGLVEADVARTADGVRMAAVVRGRSVAASPAVAPVPHRPMAA